MVLGIAALAAGLFIVGPIADHSSTDDSPALTAALVLIFGGVVVAVASAGLWAGEELWWRVSGRRAGRGNGSRRPRRR